jgi:phosphoglycolate phosphatase
MSDVRLFSAVLLDLDGTLCDPREGITRCIQHALEQLGRESPSEEDLARFIGPPLRETFAALLGGADRATVEKAVAAFRERYTDVGIFENRLYGGIPALLERLEELGHRVLLATSKPAVFAERILAHFSIARHFEAVYGPGLDGRHDDKTEMIRFLLQQERIDPGATALAGDRRRDIEAAKRNDLFAIGVTYGYGTETELAAAGADVLARSPARLLECLERGRPG